MEILKLGLLFGEDVEATTEELPEVLSFQHKLLQEYLAAVYIAENARMDPTSAFLTDAFPTWDDIKKHKEVIQFACGVLADSDASPVTNHLGKLLGKLICKELVNEATHFVVLDLVSNTKESVSLLNFFQKEGNVTINWSLCQYPSCGHPLAEVLAKTELVYITGIAENDTLDLNPSSTQILMNLEEVDSERFDKLWRSLDSIHANLMVLHLFEVRGANAANLRHFSRLKYLSIEYHIWNESGVAGEDLAKSINSWQPEPQLTYCNLHNVHTTRSLMIALCKCTRLLSLGLDLCNLQSTDVDHITQTIKAGRFSNLRALSIGENPVGEDAVRSLLEALIYVKHNPQFRLWIQKTCVNERGNYVDLPDNFQTEWKAKLSDTDIDVVKWHTEPDRGDQEWPW